MKNDIHPLRLLLKTIILFIAINLIFAVIYPPVGKITLYNYVVPGRLRFPYEQEPSYYFVGYNAPIYEDFDAMFGAHIISERKREDEFRLVLLGDSATWGISVQAREMLSEQINRLNIRTCDGRTVRAYNLGYPMPFLMRDLFILDKAMEYQPDMVFWLITLSTLESKSAETYFILPHAERYLRLAAAYDLHLPDLRQPVQKPSFLDKTMIAQRKRLKNIAFIQALGLLWASTGIDNHEGLQPPTTTPGPDVGNDIHYGNLLPGESSRLFDSLLLDVLSAGYRVAGNVPVVLVNEPMFVAEGKNHLLRYNDSYPRWIYDDYRQFMLEWTETHEHVFLDYWNALPPNDFADRNFHRNPIGEEKFAEQLASEIKNLACFQ